MDTQELLHVAKSIAETRNLEKEEVFQALEMALANSISAKYGQAGKASAIRVEIDRLKGDIDLYRSRIIASDEEFVASDHSIVSLAEAHKMNKDLDVGDSFEEKLHKFDFDRNTISLVRHNFLQLIQEIERKNQFQEFAHLEKTIISGIVKRVEFGGTIVDLGRAEGYIPHDQSIRKERLRTGERIKAYILEVKEDNKNHQIILSRSHNMFLEAVLKQEIPEINDGTIEIKAMVRDPGSRSKIAVHTNDSSIDPIGACVGLRGTRIQAISNELNGEKIDVFLWYANIAELAAHSITRVKIINSNIIEPIESGEESTFIEVVVSDENLSAAIGRGGQNIKLVSKLVDMKVNVISESKAKDRNAKLFRARSAMFSDALELDNLVGQILALEGFSAVSEIAQSAPEELSDIEDFDEDLANELIGRAKEYIDLKGDISVTRQDINLIDEETSTDDNATVDASTITDADPLIKDDTESDDHEIKEDDTKSDDPEIKEDDTKSDEPLAQEDKS